MPLTPAVQQHCGDWMRSVERRMLSRNGRRRL